MRASLLSLLLLGLLACASARYFAQNRREETAEDSHDPDHIMDEGFGKPINTDRISTDKGFSPFKRARDARSRLRFHGAQGPPTGRRRDIGQSGNRHHRPGPPGPPGSNYPRPPPGTHNDPPGSVRPRVGNKHLAVDPVQPGPPGGRQRGGGYGAPGTNQAARRYRGVDDEYGQPAPNSNVDPGYGKPAPAARRYRGVDDEYGQPAPNSNVDPGYGKPAPNVDPGYGKPAPAARRYRGVDDGYGKPAPNWNGDSEFGRPADVDHPPPLVDPGFNQPKPAGRRYRGVDDEYGQPAPNWNGDPEYGQYPNIMLPIANREVDEDFGQDAPLDPGFGKRPKIMQPKIDYQQFKRLVDEEYGVPAPQVDPGYGVDPPKKAARRTWA